MSLNIAFYAPLKPPGHPVPSGDREMARMLQRALQQAGFDTHVASLLRSYNPDGEADFGAAADAEVARLVEHYRLGPPALWFTYHVYYKAPDLIGPRVARALAIPYVIAEGSRAPKRAAGRWALGHRDAEMALDAADLIFVLNPRDRAVLETARPAHQVLADLPPFIDPRAWNSVEPRSRGTLTRLLAVAMMRFGDKFASYSLLAEALAKLDNDNWELDIVGGGPAFGDVAALFEAFGNRVHFHDAVEDRAILGKFYRQADLLVWPAVNEAFGMVFLEAALQGCPAIAGNFGGVGAVVIDGKTGLLVRPGDADDFAASLASLIADAPRRKRMSQAARAFVTTERSLDNAAHILRRNLFPLTLRQEER